MQNFQRPTLERHFVPTTGGYGARSPRPEIERISTPQAHGTSATHGVWFRVASKVFLAVIGERTFHRAISQRSVPAALLHGSLAAGTAYVQERATRGVRPAASNAVSKRSLFSFYTAIGFGLGIGAMLVNRRRG